MKIDKHDDDSADDHEDMLMIKVMIRMKWWLRRQRRRRTCIGRGCRAHGDDDGDGGTMLRRGGVKTDTAPCVDASLCVNAEKHWCVNNCHAELFHRWGCVKVDRNCAIFYTIPVWRKPCANNWHMGLSIIVYSFSEELHRVTQGGVSTQALW